MRVSAERRARRWARSLCLANVSLEPRVVRGRRTMRIVKLPAPAVPLAARSASHFDRARPRFFFAGGPAARRCESSATARSWLTEAGSSPLGIVALVSPSVT